MNKAITAMFYLSLVFIYVFSTNQANAAVRSHEVEKTFDLNCGTQVPGADPFLQPRPVTIKTNVPDVVAPGEEFQLTDTTVIVTFPMDTTGYDIPLSVDFENPNFNIISKNTDHSIRTFSSNFTLTVPPNTINPQTHITDKNGVNVGLFTAGEEGKVKLTFGEIHMNLLFPLGGPDDPVIPMSFWCEVLEDTDTTVATVPIDNEAPAITLNGDNPMIVKQGDSYEEPGATAQDNFDGDVSDDIEISGDVDTNTIGTYTVTYMVSDSVGNVSTVERTVNVVEPFGSWYTGEGPPNDSLGTNGDSYLDITTGDVYKRGPNTWTKVSNLKGDDGKQGSAILTGSGAPSADAGNVGDLYLDTNTGDVYEKTADGWKKIANLQGPAGPQGPKGPKDSDGSSGGSGSNNDGSEKSKTKTSTGSDTDPKGKSAQGGKLPKTATSLPTLILIGALLAATGGVLFLKRRNKTA
ncbi:immunoglobulin-like domain-containing protein [Pueribacillus sp. YX66]|uniref:immunoglobulin-like domain-containing protein n=1 Tax=Pueribacillus sp. YX66 TaxID=3229242 RepID=UPI00358D5246